MEHKLLLLEENQPALCSLMESSLTAFDKITELTSYAVGYQVFIIHRDPLMGFIDYLMMDDEEAQFYLDSPQKNEELFRLFDGDSSRVMLLPLQ